MGTIEYCDRCEKLDSNLYAVELPNKFGTENKKKQWDICADCWEAVFATLAHMPRDADDYWSKGRHIIKRHDA